MIEVEAVFHEEVCLHFYLDPVRKLSHMLRNIMFGAVIQLVLPGLFKALTF